MRKYRFDPEADIAEDIRGKHGYDGDLLQIYAGNNGATVHKWHHYIPIYDRYFTEFRGTGVRFLEIGVKGGGSLQMWRRYLGEDAVIFGIDIDENCAQLDGQAGQVRIGSQKDPDFLNTVVDEMGGLDVVLDDGSHRMAHIRTSFQTLFPRLNQNGIYMVEDLHTAYWDKYGGGFKAPLNFFRFVRELTDDMHRWYHPRKLRHPGLGDQISGVHVHDSIAVIEKQPVHRPCHSWVG